MGGVSRHDGLDHGGLTSHFGRVQRWDLHPRCPVPDPVGVIFCADEILRSEIWTSVQEELQDDGEWPEDRPWDLVMRITTYGGPKVTPRMTQWWFVHVIAPCQYAGSAVSFLQEMEGTKLLPFPEGYSTSLPTGQSRGGRGPKKQRIGGGHAGFAYTPDAYGPPKGKGNKGKGGKGKGGQGKGGKPKGGKGVPSK